MKLEYVPGGSSDCPLIRLYDFAPLEVEQLCRRMGELAAQTIQSIEVHRLPFVNPFDDCELEFILQQWDQAILQIAPLQFQCGFTPEGWDDMTYLLKPFIQGSTGFQWLTGVPGEANLLISSSGGW